METEIQALESNNTRTLVPLPHGKIPLWCRCVYKIKDEADGTMKDIRQHQLSKVILSKLIWTF